MTSWIECASLTSASSKSLTQTIKEKIMAQGPKPKGKYVEGQEPWTMLGIKYDAWYRRTRMGNELGEQARDALRRAQQIAGKLVEEPAPALAEPSGVVDAVAAPSTPEPVEEAATAAPASDVKPAAAMATATGPMVTAPEGTVFVSFRCPTSVHDRMREMVHKRRVKLQGIVAAAVEAYLSQNGF